ncbi:hypothetical protein [Nocardia tengchongensis]|uniref:hypothetical protein n=1 Tax=Nocardia tengchongensis TaxID=2055889 RepID=UPI00361337DE
MVSSTTIMISGRPVQLTDDEVFLATRERTPDKIQTYGVLVNGTLWPPIQLMTLVTGIPGSADSVNNYNSHTALKTLDELGFDTFERVEYRGNGRVAVRASHQRTTTNG